jgi:hypothetical protein
MRHLQSLVQCSYNAATYEQCRCPGYWITVLEHWLYSCEVTLKRSGVWHIVNGVSSIEVILFVDLTTKSYNNSVVDNYKFTVICERLINWNFLVLLHRAIRVC